MIIKFLNNNLKNESNVTEPRKSRNDSVKQFMDPFYAAVTQDLQFRKIQLPTKIFGERERERGSTDDLFLWILRNIWKHLFWRTAGRDCFFIITDIWKVFPSSKISYNRSMVLELINLEFWARETSTVPNKAYDGEDRS